MLPLGNIVGYRWVTWSLLASLLLCVLWLVLGRWRLLSLLTGRLCAFGDAFVAVRWGSGVTKGRSAVLLAVRPFCLLLRCCLDLADVAGLPGAVGSSDVIFVGFYDALVLVVGHGCWRDAAAREQ